MIAHRPRPWEIEGEGLMWELMGQLMELLLPLASLSQNCLHLLTPPATATKALGRANVATFNMDGYILHLPALIGICSNKSVC